MGRRRPYNPRARTTARRGILAQALSRALAEAEMHKDRARAGIERAEAAIKAAGPNVSDLETRLADLKAQLAAREEDIERARHAAGLDRAA